MKYCLLSTQTLSTKVLHIYYGVVLRFIKIKPYTIRFYIRCYCPCIQYLHYVTKIQQSCIFQRKCHTCCFHFRNCYTFLSENVFYELVYTYMYSKYIMLYSGDQGGIFYKSFTYKKTAKRNTYIQRIEHSSSEKAFSCFLSFDKTIKLRTH